jgi:hypothetical protein
MAKNAMPVSKAKTAYGLLSEIRKLILEEPKRYDQCATLVHGADASEFYGDKLPACGTVACVGGWVLVLKGFGVHDSLDKAWGVLGQPTDDMWDLFEADRAGSRGNIAAHAKRGAAHIAKFQKKYAAQLKAKRV